MARKGSGVRQNSAGSRMASRTMAVMTRCFSIADVRLQAALRFLAPAGGDLLGGAAEAAFAPA
jgi:hypothetical protein